MLLLFFPSRRKVFSYSPELDLLSRTFFLRGLFFGKNPQEVQTDLTKSLVGSMVLLTNLQQVEKHFPPFGFLKPIVCSVCSSIYSWDCLFLGGFGFVTFADRKPTAWLKLDVFSFFPFFQVVAETLTLCTPPSLIWKYLCLLLDVNPQKSFPISVNFSCLRNIVSKVK